jgi:hypothetical protein
MPSASPFLGMLSAAHWSKPFASGKLTAWTHCGAAGPAKLTVVGIHLGRMRDILKGATVHLSVYAEIPRTFSQQHRGRRVLRTAS